MKLAAAALLFTSAAHAGDTISELQELTFPGIGECPSFGRSAAVSGAYLAVGAARDDTDGDEFGGVYVYARGSDGLFTLEERIGLPPGTPLPDPNRGAYLGSCVQLDGDLLAATAFMDHELPGASGEVLLFRRTEGGWMHESTLRAPTGWDGDGFGQDIAIDGERVLVGAQGPFFPGVAGRAYVFARSAGTWALEQTLHPPVPVANDEYGHAVDLKGDLAVVTAPADNEPGFGAGSAHVFRFDGAAWQHDQKLVLPDAAFHENLGTDVALSMGRVLVGVPYRDTIYPQAGVIASFEHDGTSWVYELLYGPPYQGNDRFGKRLAVHGERMVVMTDQLSSGTSFGNGQARLFDHHGGSWVEVGRLMPEVGHRFFEGVALHGGIAVVEAEAGEYDGCADSVFVFELPPGPAPGSLFCAGDGSGAACPCGNSSDFLSGRGCAHSGGVGMRLLAEGTRSLAEDDLLLRAVDCPPGNSGLFYVGTVSLAPGAPLFDGLQCAGGDVRRFTPLFQEGGTAEDTGFGAQDPSGTYFVAGGTYHFQYWSRDVAAGGSPCGTGAAFSSGYRVVWLP